MSSGDGSLDPAALQAAHERLLHDSGLQLSFPTAPPEPAYHQPDWLIPLLRAFEAVAPLTKFIFWGGLAVAAALVIWFVGREMIGVRWRRRPKPAKPAAAAAEWRPAAGAAKVLLEDADRLAAEGRHAEAAHLLLLRTIGDIEGRRPDLVRPALTSRDIAGLAALPASARPAFGFIAQVVERSLFGGRPVDADAYGQCRRAYADFALPGDWA